MLEEQACPVCERGGGGSTEVLLFRQVQEEFLQEAVEKLKRCLKKSDLKELSPLQDNKVIQRIRRSIAGAQLPHDAKSWSCSKHKAEHAGPECVLGRPRQSLVLSEAWRP